MRVRAAVAGSVVDGKRTMAKGDCGIVSRSSDS